MGHHQLDTLDEQILKLIADNARIPFLEVARACNVSGAASLASVGPDNMQVSIQSTPGFTGDTQKVEIKNEQVHAVVEVYSATSEIAGWSVVNTLLNITSPIVF